MRICRILTLLMSAYSLVHAPGSVAFPLRRVYDALLPLFLRRIRGFGIMLDRQLFSAQGNSMSKLLRIF